MPTPPPKKTTKPARGAARQQRALVIGISNYPQPEDRLPGVAADVREMARVLASRNGAFGTGGVARLTEKDATRARILAAIEEVFGKARADETVFVYLAGHGDVKGGRYYFVPYDGDSGNLARTGVPLADIKRLFDGTKSRRAFLWLDFCHSGGILARRRAGDLAAIRREIGVVSGHGKVIVAACASDQLAYEDPALGHGYFTSALLRGLKGEAKSATGEVTALSLYEFIDRQVGSKRQQPVLSGELSGRIVLAHYPVRAAASAPAAGPTPAQKGASKAGGPGRIGSSGTLALVDGRFYRARSFGERHDGTVALVIAPKDAEDEAALRSLRGDRFSQRRPVAFAYGDHAFSGQVEEASSQGSGTRPAWTVVLRPAEARSGSMYEMGYNGLTVEDLAEMRGRLLLLGEDSVVRDGRRDQLLGTFVQGPLKDLGVSGSVASVLPKPRGLANDDYLRRVRLLAVYYLKAGGVCDDVLELKLGPVEAGKVQVRFRGRRKSRYSGGDPAEIRVEGACPLRN